MNLRLFGLFAKGRHGIRLLGILGVYLAFLVVAPMGTSGVPFSHEIQVPLSVIFGMVPAALCSWNLASPMSALETFVDLRLMRIMRGRWYIAITLLFAFAFIAAFVVLEVLPTVEAFGVQLDPLLACRNGLFAIGIAWIGAWAFPQTYSWLPGVIVILMLWLFGTTDAFGTPASWAFPFFALDSVMALVISVAFWGFGLGTYIFFGSDEPLFG